MAMPTNASDAMKSDSLAARLGGRAGYVKFDKYTNEWAVFGTFSGFIYSTHGNSRTDADAACEKLQKNAEKFVP
jgi:hypothetical protein